ncbi:MAG: hypothetical protein HY770_04525 [Chitinivibrionia bacterium]|nr:hypothetical protein [Chitinivibrionia bacterium]
MNARILTATAAAVLLSSGIGAREGSHAAPADTECHAQHDATAPDTAKELVFENLPGYNKKCWIGDSLYFTYKFNKKPKMGTAILVVRLFDTKDAQLSNLEILGSSDMPSMRGAHDSGEVPFKLNKKSAYLLPVNLVMPGEWEVKLVFKKGDETLFRGRFLFKI